MFPEVSPDEDLRLKTEMYMLEDSVLKVRAKSLTNGYFAKYDNNVSQNVQPDTL